MINSPDLKNLELLSSKLLLKAGEKILKSWHDIKSISYKDLRDFSTNIDSEIEDFLRKNLKNIFPDAGFLVEEGTSIRKELYNWVIDPIDQTKNYGYHLPMFFTQIALLENNIPILGHIYQPVSRQLFSASRGNGASLNNDKLLFKQKRPVSEAIIDIDYGAGHNQFSKKNIEILSKLFDIFYRVRISGGAFPIYLTTDALDSYLVLNNETKIVDQAPRIIILKEAGFKTEYVHLNNRQILISASEEIFDIIRNIILNYS